MRLPILAQLERTKAPDAAQCPFNTLPHLEHISKLLAGTCTNRRTPRADDFVIVLVLVLVLETSPFPPSCLCNFA